MNPTVYSSVLKDELHDFMELRGSQGFKDSNRYIWGTLDQYLVSIGAAEKELTPEVVECWISANCNGLSARSVGSYITHYNAFARYLNSIGISAFSSERPLLDHNYVPYIFSTQEIADIFRIADNRKGKYKLTRFQFPMLLRILYGCGLRLGEALALRLSDVGFEDGVLHIWHGKGNKDRLVPMDKTLTRILKMYCDTMFVGKSSDSYLFESDYKDGRRNCIGCPRHPSWAQGNFQRVLKEAGIERHKHSEHDRGVCLHCLRHTFAINSFRKQDLAGIDNYQNAPLLSIYLGHYELKETQKYLHMTAENSDDIINLTAEYSRGLFPEVPQ
jgi:integrase/recombinase XerD